jgi:hypothetical protein
LFESREVPAARPISLGNDATPVGSSTLVPDPQLSALSQYSRADEAPVPVTQ